MAAMMPIRAIETIASIRVKPCLLDILIIPVLPLCKERRQGLRGPVRCVQWLTDGDFQITPVLVVAGRPVDIDFSSGCIVEFDEPVLDNPVVAEGIVGFCPLGPYDGLQSCRSRQCRGVPVIRRRQLPTRRCCSASRAHLRQSSLRWWLYTGTRYCS